MPPSHTGHPRPMSMFLTGRTSCSLLAWGTLARTLRANTLLWPSVLGNEPKPLVLRQSPGRFTRAPDIGRGTQADYQEAKLYLGGWLKEGYTRVLLETQLFPNIDTMLSELSRDRPSDSAPAPSLTVAPHSILSINVNGSAALKRNSHSFHAYGRLMGQALKKQS